MATQVRDVYLQICDELLEPGGLVLGLITVNDFLGWFGEVVNDFMTKVSLAKKLNCIDVQAGVDTYTISDYVSDTVYAAYDQSYLHRTSTFYLDNSDSIWAGTTDVPTTWKQDEVQAKQLQVSPIPNENGDPVNTLLGQGLYGQIAATSNTNDLQIIGPPAGLFGTINGFSGTPYLETLTPLFGTIASMTVSVTNLETIATAIPRKITNWQLGDTIDLIPDSATPYIKYGILARIWSQDGEQKDEFKAVYANARYTEGINLFGAIMSQAFEQENAQ
jgi:hypothetical protein